MTERADSEAITDDIRITASARFLPDQSDPGRGSYAYVYRIVIKNEGARAAKLLARHWIVVDGDGNRHDVKGAGVVGEQPRIQPGESFEYMSSCPLATSWGTMEGSYTFERDDGDRFPVAIARFFLVPSVPEPLRQQ